MSNLEAALVARAHRDGHASVMARVRHRRLVDEPLAIVLQQLGAEPFSAGAIGFGTSPLTCTWPWRATRETATSPFGPCSSLRAGSIRGSSASVLRAKWSYVVAASTPSPRRHLKWWY